MVYPISIVIINWCIQMNNLYKYFEQILKISSKKEAVVDQNKKYTYGDMLKGVLHLRCIFRASGIKQNDRVIIHLPKSAEFLASVMALLSIGACYVPVDCFSNQKRKEYICCKTDANIIITNEDIGFEFEGKIIYLKESLKEMLVPGLIENDFDYNFSNDLRETIAYIMFTSGTTGNPKGVMIQQKGLINLLESSIKEIGFQCGNSILFLSNVSFDMSIPESLLALCTGMRIIIIPDNQRQNYRYIIHRIIEEKIGVLHVTPRRLEHILLLGCNKDVLQTVKTIILGAEKVSEGFLEKIKKYTKAKIYNFYGPTEATVFSTISDLTNKKQVDIGFPIDNVKIYLLDKDGNEVKNGEIGEIVIAGEGVSLGYINDPDETAKRFILHNSLEESKIYKSGDFAIKNKEGALVLRGRKDNQVKFRGYRIELEELESLFLKATGVQECMACPLRYKNTETMYMCFTHSGELEKEKIKEFAAMYMPYYITPLSLIEIKEFPINNNGKIDRKKFMYNLKKAINNDAFLNNGEYKII